MSGQDAWATTIAIPLVGLLIWLVWRLIDSSKNESKRESPADKQFAKNHRQFSHQDFQDTWPLNAAPLPIQPQQKRVTPSKFKFQTDSSPRLIKGNRSSSVAGNRWLFIRGYFKRNGTYVSGYFRRVFSSLWYSYKFSPSTSKEKSHIKPFSITMPYIPATHPIIDAEHIVRPQTFVVDSQVPSDSQSLSNHRGDDLKIEERYKVDSVAPVTFAKVTFQPQPHVKKLSVPTYWSGQTVVRGHIRKNGTYVAAHTRRKSGSSAWKAPRRK